MVFLDAAGRAALTAGLRASATFPESWEERPPTVSTALVLDGVFGPGVLDDIAAYAASPTDTPRRRPPLPAVREDVDGAIGRAFAPLEIRTEVHVLRSDPGWSTLASDPFDYTAAGTDEAGWWSTVRLVVPLVASDAVSWTMHGATGDLVLRGAGALGIVGPRTSLTVEHEEGTTPMPWLTSCSRMRYPHRRVQPQVRLIAR